MNRSRYSLCPWILSSIDGPQAAETDGAIRPADSNLYNYIMKMVTLIAGDSYEVFVCDRLVFDRYAREGAFDDITELYTSWQSELPDQVKPLRRRIDAGDDQRPVDVDPADNFDLSLPILGLDVNCAEPDSGAWHLRRYPDSDDRRSRQRSGRGRAIPEKLDA
ncbi:MAG: hypothetical protein ACOX1A_02370 [Saccharofermentanales bacterium]